MSFSELALLSLVLAIAACAVFASLGDDSGQPCTCDHEHVCSGCLDRERQSAREEP